MIIITEGPHKSSKTNVRACVCQEWNEKETYIKVTVTCQYSCHCRAHKQHGAARKRKEPTNKLKTNSAE